MEYGRGPGNVRADVRNCTYKVIIDTNGQDGEEVKEPAPEQFPAQTERVLQRDISVTKELN